MVKEGWNRRVPTAAAEGYAYFCFIVLVGFEGALEGLCCMYSANPRASM